MERAITQWREGGREGRDVDLGKRKQGTTKPDPRGRERHTLEARRAAAIAIATARWSGVEGKDDDDNIQG